MNQDAATGFLITASVLLPGQIGKDEPSIRLARQDSLDEIVVNIGQTFLGLSIGCARCHDHKFDPVSQKDYYAMQAFIAGVEYADRELASESSDAADERRQKIAVLRKQLEETDFRLTDFQPQAGGEHLRPPVNATINVDRFVPVTARRLRFTILSTNSLEPCLDEVEVYNTAGRNIAASTAGTTVASSGDRVSPNRHELRFVNDSEYGNSRSWMSDEVGKGWIELTFAADEKIDRVVWGRDRQAKFFDRLATQYRIEISGSIGTTERTADEKSDWRIVADSSDRTPFDGSKNQPQSIGESGLTADQAQTVRELAETKASLQKSLTKLSERPMVFAGRFRTPDNIHRLHRGDPEQPREPVMPAVPAVFGEHSPGDTAEAERRQFLARWICSPENPLTARVMVNRIWQGHFGTGLVETSSDFGHMGTRPSHPELLDWLAQEFISSGWSIKHLHRLIVLSAVYRQASVSNPAAAAVDAGNRLLWSSPMRRMDAETIRDSMLQISGELNLKTGGPGFNLFAQRGGLSGFTPVESFPVEGLRRMIYAHKVRRERDSVFGAFDCPDAGQSTARRIRSTTPIQALNLLNSRFTLERANSLADRIQGEVGADPTRQADDLWQRVLCRDPDDTERRLAVETIRNHGLATVCRALLNSNEFLFIP
ncbi:MAG: DUF1553 domain-containing protein [Planctomycetaceae bacterium]